MTVTVGDHYRIIRRVSAGSFGEVFAGEDMRSNEEVAVKLEPIKARSPRLL